MLDEIQHVWMLWPWKHLSFYNLFHQIQNILDTFWESCFVINTAFLFICFGHFCNILLLFFKLVKFVLYNDFGLIEKKSRECAENSYITLLSPCVFCSEHLAIAQFMCFSSWYGIDMSLTKVYGLHPLHYFFYGFAHFSISTLKLLNSYSFFLLVITDY